MIEGLDVVAEKKCTKEENDRHEEDVVIEEDAFSRALFTNVASKQGRGAVSQRIIPVGAKVRGVCEILHFQAVHGGKLVAVTHPSHGGVNEPLIIGVVPVYSPESGKGLVDEYESNDSSEYLLRESGEELHHSARVERHKTNHKEGRPESNPETEIEEWNPVRGTKIENNLLKDDGRPSGSKNYKRLARKNAENEIANSDS